MLGYAAMNRTLRDRDPPLRCNRSMRKQTWESRGLSYASELTLQNLTDLLAILRWNVDHDIRFYRCSSTLVPWHSGFELDELPDFPEIEEIAERIGAFVVNHDVRLTFHPDYWCKLASPSSDTVDRSLTEVENHASWFELMGLPHSPYYGVNVHIGARYDGKAETAERFRETVRRLSPEARAHLTVENDDKESLWSVSELVREVGDPLGVPVVFDYHHHAFSGRDLSYREAFDRARSTWDGVRPATHYSEPACLRGADARPQAHARYVADLPGWLREGSDVMIEADGKERAVFRVRDDDDRSAAPTP
jgi:UV DNA damage endonuclease